MVSASRRWTEPWFCLLAGLFGCVLCFLGRVILPETLDFWTALFPWLFLLVAGWGLASSFNAESRWNAETGDEPRSARLTLGRMALAGLLLIGFAGWTGLFAYSFFDQEPQKFGPELAAILWLFFAPLAFMAGLRAWSASPPALERALQWATLTGCVGFARLALPDDWATLRMFLLVAAIVFSVIAALGIVSQRLRRAVISGFLVFHFLGVISATMAHPPGPWIFEHLWVRFFRPYLEFVNINNAYRFFSPNPGTSTYYWFRVFFDSGEKDAQGNKRLEAIWYKIPDTDDQGNHAYASSLEYQRLLAVTENAAPIDGNHGEAFQKSLWLRRYNAPRPWKIEWEDKIGDARERPPWVGEIPMHPKMSFEAQYAKPTHTSLIFIQSYCRHVAAKVKHPHHADWPIECIKVYRVVHTLSNYAQFIDPQIRRHPNDPETYLPYYSGKFDGNGEMVKDDDPYLYWLLPILREPWGAIAKDATIRNWCHLHAGDLHWVKQGAGKEWQAVKPVDVLK